MSIAGETLIQQLQWRGHDDPSLPEGIWWASLATVGDASGGTQRNDILFKPEGEPLDGSIYSLEQLTAFISNASNTDGFLQITGLSPPQPGSSFLDRFLHLQFESMGSAIGNAALDGGKGGFGSPLLPLLLGSARGTIDSEASLRVGTNNLTATDSLSVTALGYRWGPRAVLALGGPQRPERAIFGA